MNQLVFLDTAAATGGQTAGTSWTWMIGYIVVIGA